MRLAIVLVALLIFNPAPASADFMDELRRNGRDWLEKWEQNGRRVLGFVFGADDSNAAHHQVLEVKESVAVQEEPALVYVPSNAQYFVGLADAKARTVEPYRPYRQQEPTTSQVAGAAASSTDDGRRLLAAINAFSCGGPR